MNNSTTSINSDGWLDWISKSPAMIGIAVLLINMGGRYIANDITRYDEKFLNNRFMKKLTIFSIAFLSTRDIRYSIIIVFSYSILFNPCGLAYKIMKKTENLINPFTFFNNIYSDVGTDIDTNSLQKSIKTKKHKLNINKIKIH
jgi:hypothetical protein